MAEKHIRNIGELKDQITAAIGAHGMWKQRIRSAAQTGMSEWKPDEVESSHNCDFGKWLDSFNGSEKTAQFKKIFALHADFHLEAGRVLKLALTGRKEEAEKAMAMGSKYDQLTTNLTRAMMEWRESA